MGIWIKVAAVVVVAVLAASVFVAWWDARKEQAALQVELKTTQQALAEATARQASRDAAVDTERPASPPSSGQAESGPYTGKNGSSVPDGIQPRVNFPAADLKPLYDFAVDCKACQAKLGEAQADLADEKVKSQALGRERDDALRAAKGGSILRRIARAAKRFAIGAAAGTIAAKAAHL